MAFFKMITSKIALILAKWFKKTDIHQINYLYPRQENLVNTSAKGLNSNFLLTFFPSDIVHFRAFSSQNSTQVSVFINKGCPCRWDWNLYSWMDGIWTRIHMLQYVIPVMNHLSRNKYFPPNDKDDLDLLKWFKLRTSTFTQIYEAD